MEKSKDSSVFFAGLGIGLVVGYALGFILSTILGLS